MGAPFKMKMKSYGKGKNPITQLGVMNAMGGVLGGRKRNPRNPNPQNLQNPNPQNPTNAAQGVIAGARNIMPR